MTKTQYYTATSLDGYIADEHTPSYRLFEVDRAEGGNGTRPARFFVMKVLCGHGATTTSGGCSIMTILLDRPEKWHAYYGQTPCWVFTHRALPPIPGADIRFVQGDVRPVHQEMTQAAGDRNVWLVGGGELVGQFADGGLLDEVLVGIPPVVARPWSSLLPRRLTAADLELLDVARDKQFARLSYRLRR